MRETAVGEPGGEHDAPAVEDAVTGGDAVAARMGPHVEDEGLAVVDAHLRQGRAEGAQQGQRVDDAVLFAPRRAADFRAPADFRQLFLKLGAVDHVALVFPEGLAQLFNVVAALLVVGFAQDRDDPARKVDGYLLPRGFLKLPDQLREEPRGDEAPFGVVGQVEKFGLAPDQADVGPRRLVGFRGRVEHGHLAALARKPVRHRASRHAAAHHDDVMFRRIHRQCLRRPGCRPDPRLPAGRGA